MNLSVVIPIYNEEVNLPVLYERMTAAMQKSGLSYEVILVNDGSRDKSLQIIKDFASKDSHIKFIDFSRNFGHQIAIYAGMDLSSGDHVCFIDGDLQDPPELIAEMYQTLKQGDYQVVYAQRKTRKGVSPLKKFAYKMFYKILARITDVEIPLDTGDFRIITRKIVTQIQQMSEQPKFLRGQIAWVGFKQKAFEYDRDERAGGEPGYTYSKLIRLALDGITSFSDFPLKLATMSGFFVSFISFIAIIFFIVRKILDYSQPPGWASLMVIVLFLGGIQLITIGIIGEYISRINTNSKKRPLYIVSETNIEK